jgi:transposase
MPGVDEVCAQLPAEHELEDAGLDKGYESQHIRETFKAHDSKPVIPPKSNRIECIEYDKDTYKLREKIERFFTRVKQFRRIATRYDTLGSIFLAFIHIVASYLIVK